MNSSDKKKDEKEKDDKDIKNPRPPGSPENTPIESPEEEIPMGDPQTKKDKAPRMG